MCGVDAYAQHLAETTFPVVETGKYVKITQIKTFLPSYL